jgi:uncharacterized phage protein (TIGR01671 family)
MNREIKFRAWRKNEMVEFELGEVLCDDKLKVLEFKDLPVMQYTGLKDKNGNEIYEGDIIDASGHGGVMVVRYDSPYNACFCVDNILLGVIDDTDIEILGNIYENADMLAKAIT